MTVLEEGISQCISHALQPCLGLTPKIMTLLYRGRCDGQHRELDVRDEDVGCHSELKSVTLPRDRVRGRTQARRAGLQYVEVASMMTLATVNSVPPRSTRRANPPRRSHPN